MARQAKPPVATEHAEQVALIHWVDLAARKHPELRNFFAVANGGNRHIVTAKKLKAEGVRAGVPDLMLAVPSLGHHGLFIEMKRRRGGVVSDEQTDWIARLQAHGYCVSVCRGWDEARRSICAYLGIAA